MASDLKVQARKAIDPEVRETYLSMAAIWIKLAEELTASLEPSGEASWEDAEA